MSRPVDEPADGPVDDPLDRVDGAPDDGVPDDGAAARSAGRRASDRSVAAVVSGAAAVALVSLVALLPVPFAVEAPGPVRDVLSADGAQRLITVTGAQTHPTSGSLDLTTVRISGGPGRSLDLGTQVRAWLDPDTAVLPEDLLFPPGATEEQVDESNAAAFTSSQQAAVVAALTELGYDVPVHVVVTGTTKGSGSEGVLREGDVVTAVDGTAVTDAESLRAAVTAAGVGAEVVVGVERDGAATQERVRLTTGQDGAPVLGVLVREDADPPVDVKIAVDQIGGPSAGLVFALGVVDLLTPGEMTGGRTIAGTGTIDATGAVGAIGGIRQKMLGARAAGATAFLAPASNCDDVVGHVPDGLQVVAVSTLAGARSAVEAIGSGDGADLPTCS